MEQKKKEILIVAGMVLVSLIVIFVMKITDGGSTVVVTVSGEVYGEYKLNKNQQIEIISENGVNVLEIKDGRARVISATCPDKICVNMSPLTEDEIGLIVCLPNEVVVELKEKKRVSVQR